MQGLVQIELRPAFFYSYNNIMLVGKRIDTGCHGNNYNRIL